MKIPAFKLVHGEMIPIYVLQFLQCPQGLYGIVVMREPRTLQEKVPQPMELSQIILDDDYFKNENPPKKAKKALVE